MLPASSNIGRWPQPLTSLMLLLLWTILGAALRMIDLELKPPWTDEFATLVFSLGNSFKSVALDRVISFQDLLAPLIPNPHATVGNVVRQVFGEDHQPPIYFALAHLWMQLFPTDGGLVNLWSARALPAVIGILTIPMIYIGSYFTWRSPIVAHLTAAMFAVSPYGVYIAQEARHYSLAILWTTISISCLAIACRQISRQQKLPILLIIVWIVVNNLGFATHYFFGIALIAEALVLSCLSGWQVCQLYTKPSANKSELSIVRDTLLHPSWQRLYIEIVGTGVGIAVGLWLLTHSSTPQTTAWIDNTPYKSIELVNPWFQVIGALITMMSLLLVEVTELPPVAIFSDIPLDLNLPIVITSAILMLIFFVWAIPALNRGIRIQLKQSHLQISTMAICSFVAISIGLYLVIPWLTGIKIDRGARYHFVYFPAVMMLIGLGLASCWQSVPSIAKWVSGKQAVTIVLLMGLVSSTIVTTNYGYHKYYRPEQIVPMIQQSSPQPVLIATTHNSLVQVGEMMGLAWELRRTDKIKQTARINFLLAHQSQKFCDRAAVFPDRECPTTKILRETVDRISHSIDLWAINFHAPISLPPTCDEDKKFTRGIYGYQYRLYHCQPIKDLD
jgi:uncharacterized membrane protein